MAETGRCDESTSGARSHGDSLLDGSLAANLGECSVPGHLNPSAFSARNGRHRRGIERALGSLIKILRNSQQSVGVHAAKAAVDQVVGDYDRIMLTGSG